MNEDDEEEEDDEDVAVASHELDPCLMQGSGAAILTPPLVGLVRPVALTGCPHSRVVRAYLHMSLVVLRRCSMLLVCDATGGRGTGPPLLQSSAAGGAPRSTSGTEPTTSQQSAARLRRLAHRTPTDDDDDSRSVEELERSRTEKVDRRGCWCCCCGCTRAPTADVAHLVD